MAMGVRELLDSLNRIDLFHGGRKVVRRDLIDPSSEFAQTIVFKFLTEFGFSENLMDTKRAARFVVQDVPNGELMLLAAAANKFFRSIQYGDQAFGLFDLTSPEPKRLQQFLIHFVNFWIFSNDRAEALNCIKERVEAKANLSKSLGEDIKNKQKLLDDLKQRNERLKVQNHALNEEISGRQDDLKDTSEASDRLNKQYQEVKSRCNDGLNRVGKLEAEVDGLEKEKRQLHDLLKGDQVKKELENELRGLREEETNKMLDIQRVKSSLQEYNAKAAEFALLRDELKNLAETTDKIKVDAQHLERVQLQLRDVRCQKSDVEKDIVQLQADLRAVKAEHANKAENQQKKEGCLATDIDDFRQELDVVRKGKTQDEIVAMDLENEIGQLEKEIERCQKGTREQVDRRNYMFRTLVDAYKKFEDKLQRDLEVEMAKPFK